MKLQASSIKHPRASIKHHPALIFKLARYYIFYKWICGVVARHSCNNRVCISRRSQSLRKSFGRRWLMVASLPPTALAPPDDEYCILFGVVLIGSGFPSQESFSYVYSMLLNLNTPPRTNVSLLCMPTSCVVRQCVATWPLFL